MTDRLRTARPGPAAPGRRRLLLGAGACAALAAAPALVRAQAGWPARPVRLVVPFTPGGTTDHVTRLVATELARQLGQPVVVENKPGSGTTIGVDAVAKAAPDGHAFVTVANSYTVNATLLKKLPYAMGDLRPVALMGMSEHVLATPRAAACAAWPTCARRRPAAWPMRPSARAPRRTWPARCSRLPWAWTWSTCPTRARRRRWPTCWVARWP